MEVHREVWLKLHVLPRLWISTIAWAHSPSTHLTCSLCMSSPPDTAPGNSAPFADTPELLDCANLHGRLPVPEHGQADADGPHSGA